MSFFWLFTRQFSYVKWYSVLWFPRYLLSTAVENIDLGHLEALASVCMWVCEHVHMCVATYFAAILWVGLSVNC